MNIPALPNAKLTSAYWAPEGAIIRVNAGMDFQAALDRAEPGDTIVLEAGAVFTGNFTLPVKTGGIAGADIYIISSLLSQLGPEGTRVQPESARYMPKIVTPNNDPAIQTLGPTRGWRFSGCEIFTMAPLTYNLIHVGNVGEKQDSASKMPSAFVFDRCYVHGNSTGNLYRGITLNCGSAQIVDCLVRDCHVVGSDAQAICGWNGTGPYRIANCGLEAAGENVMFGGSDPSIPSLVPADIEIVGCSFWKNYSERVGTPDFVHKNLLEFKSARRVRVADCTFEFSWAEPDGQHGFAIVITPRNQDGTAPWTVVEDITIENSVIRHAANGVNILGRDDQHVSEQTKRVLLRNLLFEDISGTTYGDKGHAFQIGGGAADVSIDHVTVLQDGSPIFFWGAPNDRLTLTNSILSDGPYGVAGDGTAGNPELTLITYAADAVVTRNAFIGGASRSAKYPVGNIFPINITEVPDEIGYRVSGMQAPVPTPAPPPAPAPPPPAPVPAPVPTPTPPQPTPVPPKGGKGKGKLKDKLAFWRK
jgi:hypothetical protein